MVPNEAVMQNAPQYGVTVAAEQARSMPAMWLHYLAGRRCVQGVSRRRRQGRVGVGLSICRGNATGASSKVPAHVRQLFSLELTESPPATFTTGPSRSNRPCTSMQRANMTAA